MCHAFALLPELVRFNCPAHLVIRSKLSLRPRRARRASLWICGQAIWISSSHNPFAPALATVIKISRQSWCDLGTDRMAAAFEVVALLYGKVVVGTG